MIHGIFSAPFDLLNYQNHTKGRLEKGKQNSVLLPQLLKSCNRGQQQCYQFHFSLFFIQKLQKIQLAGLASMCRSIYSYSAKKKNLLLILKQNPQKKFKRFHIFIYTNQSEHKSMTLYNGSLDNVNSNCKYF